MVRGLTARCVTKYSVKNDCTSAGKDGALAAVGLRMALSRARPWRHLRLELFGSKRHQFRHSGEIPVGIAYPRMPYVGRERQHRLIDVDTLALPGQHPPHDEGMACVVNARGVVGAAVGRAHV